MKTHSQNWHGFSGGLTDAVGWYPDSNIKTWRTKQSASSRNLQWASEYNSLSRAGILPTVASLQSLGSFRQSLTTARSTGYTASLWILSASISSSLDSEQDGWLLSESLGVRPCWDVEGCSFVFELTVGMFGRPSDLLTGCCVRGCCWSTEKIKPMRYILVILPMISYKNIQTNIHA